MAVRTDLPTAQQLVQAVHAGYEAGIRFGNPHQVDSVVVCQVSNEEELLRMKDRLDQREIRSYVFREPDIGDQATALATEPIMGPQRKTLARYPLWEPQEA